MVLKASDIELKKIEFKSRNIEMISPFTRVADKHSFRCLLDGYEWQSTFDNISRGKGCRQCKYSKESNKRKIETEEVNSRIKDFKSRNIELISKYTFFSQKHKFRCLVDDCNHEWSVSLDSVCRGSGCSKCSKRKPSRKTKFDVNQVVADLLKRNIEVTSKFGYLYKKHSFKCLVPTCNYEWTNNLNRVWQKGSKCEKCIGKIIDDKEIEIRKLELKKRNIKLISKFTNVAAKVEFECLKSTCGHHWFASFSSVYSSKKGCPRCVGRHKTEEEKIRIKAQNVIRVRLSSLASKLNIEKPYKTKGEYNELVSYFVDQYIEFITDNPKPIGCEKYELDHIIPLSMFSPYSTEEQKLCWHKNNLQWLTRFENISKLNRIKTKYFNVWHYETLSKIGVSNFVD